ncbi:hypothetical protein [Roseospira goensis]|uniref:BASS family bile acid:Na+ symporter n=1 Tax=Roseospira goensis TaxID=391922 RepID=A0A7W6RZR2_9PROT|nr:hypothetical protein [Roseospira goensis]MBB4286235.1 BASS family bile acid:Na+ symporter [Roseospira goensis]
MRVVLAVLDHLGRHATLVLAGGALFGLALPQLSALARPLLAPLVIALLAMALLRVRADELVAHLRRPAVTALGAAWLLLGTAPLTALVLDWVGPLDTPGVTAGMVLMAATAPITAAPAIGLMMGLPLPLTLAVTLLATVLAPLTLPGLTLALLDMPLDLEAGALAGRLAVVVGGGVALAMIARRLAPPDWRARHARRLDGVAVILLFGFALAIMGAVAEPLTADPLRVLRLIGLSFVVCGGLMVVTALVFAPCGRATALGLGYLASSRNMGLLLAALPAGADPGLALWFALAQFPLYMLPALLRPILGRLLGPAGGTG